MAEPKWRQGDRGTYEGIMTKRRGQQVEVAITSTGGLVSLRFPDGEVIGCPPASLVRM